MNSLEAAFPFCAQFIPILFWSPVRAFKLAECCLEWPHQTSYQRPTLDTQCSCKPRHTIFSIPCGMTGEMLPWMPYGQGTLYPFFLVVFRIGRGASRIGGCTAFTRDSFGNLVAVAFTWLLEYVHCLLCSIKVLLVWKPANILADLVLILHTPAQACGRISRARCWMDLRGLEMTHHLRWLYWLTYPIVQILDRSWFPVTLFLDCKHLELWILLGDVLLWLQDCCSGNLPCLPVRCTCFLVVIVLAVAGVVIAVVVNDSEDSNNNNNNNFINSVSV